MKIIALIMISLVLATFLATTQPENKRNGTLLGGWIMFSFLSVGIYLLFFK